MTPIHPQPLTAEAFSPFGDVLETTGAPDRFINQGKCKRFHDRALLDFADGRAGISVFEAEPRILPYTLDMMERHPLGSQAFIPMHMSAFLVIVAQNIDNTPGYPLAFLTRAGQGINFHRNVWHGVLTPLHAPGLFTVIDRIGDGANDGENLEEHWFETPYLIANA